MKHLSKILVLILALTLCACSSSQASEKKDGLIIKNFDGNKQEIEESFDKVPTKVLAVYQNSIETMLALGLEDHILAAAALDHDVKPEYAKAFKKVKYLSKAPDEESVLAMKPDMILSWSSYFGEKTLGDVKKWQDKGVKTYISSNTATKRVLENEYTDILNLGKIFKVEDRANKLVEEMKDKVTQVKEKTKNDAKKKVLVIEYLNGEATVYGKETLAGDMVTQLNGEIVNSDGAKFDSESILAIDPDVIFTVYMDEKGKNMAKESVENVTKNPKLKNLRAVTSKKVFPIELGETYCSGIRTIDGLNVLDKGMHE